MESNTYMFLVKTSTTPGAGMFQVRLQAPDGWVALQMARAQYGALLLSEAATPIHEGDAN